MKFKVSKTKNSNIKFSELLELNFSSSYGPSLKHGDERADLSAVSTYVCRKDNCRKVFKSLSGRSRHESTDVSHCSEWSIFVKDSSNEVLEFVGKLIC